MSAAKQATKYLFAIATVYMCYLTHGVQAIIFSQNQVNFYTQWGFTDATAGAAAVSTAIMWVAMKLRAKRLMWLHKKATYQMVGR